MSAWSLVRVSKAPVAVNLCRKSFSKHFVSCAISDTLIDSSPSNDATDTLLDGKLGDLEHFLSIGGNPSRIWWQYTGLLNRLGHTNLPLEIHQQVLRKCTPPSSELRSFVDGRLLAENPHASPHIYEGRLQAVVRAIRSMGMKPDLEDYHFILEQFAAVGHHVGVTHVYKELLFIGFVPSTKTFGLCFQTIAHRLTLPIQEANRSKLVTQAKKMTAELLSDMQKYHVPLTSVNLDLCVRILKETLDWGGFNSLMKWGYGIDLSNPDRIPLEYIGIENRKFTSDIPNVTLPALPAPLPFSTAALNTTIDMIGRLGDASKLVQAFEVLTQPLPQANQHLFSSFDDDDFGVPVTTPDSFKPPYAEPNTTTFSLLIRHLCQMGHATLARHYIIQLIELDKKSKHSLRIALRAMPLNMVTAPRVAVNRGALLPVFGESNRDKNVGLMRWLNTKLPRIIRKKRKELVFFTQLRERLTCAQDLRHQRESPHSSNFPLPSVDLPPSTSVPMPKPSTKYSPSRGRRNPVKASTAFDSGLAQQPAAPSSANLMHERKPLDVDLHIQILERDAREIQELASQVDDILGRTIQRVKERLGRRIWVERDIFLCSEQSRVQVSRDTWADKANFQPRRGYIPDAHTPPRLEMPSASLQNDERDKTSSRRHSNIGISQVAGTAVSDNSHEATCLHETR